MLLKALLRFSFNPFGTPRNNPAKDPLLDRLAAVSRVWSHGTCDPNHDLPRERTGNVLTERIGFRWIRSLDHELGVDSVFIAAIRGRVARPAVWLVRGAITGSGTSGRGIRLSVGRGVEGLA